jgi:capsule polysaccharide export protein KpsE/RkpR
LVGRRFSEKSLSAEVSRIFDEKIMVADFTNHDNFPTDYDYMFNSEREDTYGYFNIYVLKHLNVGHDGTTLYVTEIAYELE